MVSRVPFGLFFWVLFLQEQEKYRLRLFRKEKFLLDTFLSLVKEKYRPPSRPQADNFFGSFS